MTAILSLGTALPECRRTNEDILALVATTGNLQHHVDYDGSYGKAVTPTAEKLAQLMEVEERRIVTTETIDDLATVAARRALGDETPDAIICATIASGVYPSIATRIHHELKAPLDSFVVDLTSTEPGVDGRDVARALDCMLVESGRREGSPERGIVNACAPGHRRPVAAVVRERLGFPPGSCQAFDIHAACAGFGYGLTIASALIERGLRRVLLIAAETLSPEVDYLDVNSPLFGDGAGAALVGIGPGLEIVATATRVRSDERHLIFRDARGMLRMPEGRRVFKFAVADMSEASADVMRQAGMDTIDLLVPHQANSRILVKTADNIGVPHDRVAMTLPRYGNMSCATVPVALAECLCDARDIVLTYFGSGLVSGATALRRTAAELSPSMPVAALAAATDRAPSLLK